ncbi:ABC1 family protein-like protein [Venturia nashicola]|nr:ABC1 family protein-like protein [Venturia nashicola]
MATKSFITPWTCRSCLGRTSIPKSSPFRPQQRFNNYATQTTLKPKKKRRLLYASAAGLGIAGAAVAFNDDAKHFAGGAKRTGRVVGTLFININDYRVTLKNDDPIALKACHKRCAERTLVTLEKNGSIFIKLGQHLSSLTYLLPSEWCDTFIPLQDRCPVSSFESIEEMCLKDTGKPLSFYFSEFEKEPIGAASLAQVHRAVIKETGERVAVKVQHPALDLWSNLDLRLTHFTFVTLKKWFPEYDLTWLSDEMEVSLPQELDFRREGQNAMHAREYFSHCTDAPVIIPRVLWAQRRILVMDYVTGHRPDDLKYLDENKIDRDEVSAALARIFNEMIFGRDAPLHCDPHGGNIAIRHNPKPKWGSPNFDVILYDHGLYRDIPLPLRRSYAKLWLAVLDGDEPAMRKYAYEVGGVSDESFPLFASAITGRDYTVLTSEGGVAKPRTKVEKDNISDALGDGMLAELVQLLGKVPRVLLLVLKTNDLTRSLDEGLQTRQGSVRTFLILARYASRTVYEEKLDKIRGTTFYPTNLIKFFRAWFGHLRVEAKLTGFEWYLTARRVLGMKALEMRI